MESLRRPTSVPNEGKWIGIISVLLGAGLFPLTFFTFLAQYKNAAAFGRLAAESRPDLFILNDRPPVVGFILDNYKNPFIFALPAGLAAILLFVGLRNLLGKLKPVLSVLVMLAVLGLFALYLFYFPPKIRAQAVLPVSAAAGVK